jgi:hypothetical protein
MIGDQGNVSLNGSYSVPPGPDWIWMVEFVPRLPGKFELRMDNISPEGRSHLAVQAEYIRKE